MATDRIVHLKLKIVILLNGCLSEFIYAIAVGKKQGL